MGDVSYKFLVRQFVTRYIQDKKAALDWAAKNIKPELVPKLKPLIQEALKKRGMSSAIDN